MKSSAVRGSTIRALAPAAPAFALAVTLALAAAGVVLAGAVVVDGFKAGVAGAGVSVGLAAGAGCACRRLVANKRQAATAVDFMPAL